MTVDLDMINVTLNGEKFVRRLLTAKRSRDAVMRYAALIAYLSEVRAMGRGASKSDAEPQAETAVRVAGALRRHVNHAVDRRHDPVNVGP